MFPNQTASPARFPEHHDCSPVPVFAPEHTVRREQLLHRLIPPDGGDKRLRLLLTAPAGFGKTVLAAQLAAALGNRCIWQAVAGDDRDARLLLGSLFHAVQAVLAHCGSRPLVWEELSSAPLARPQVESTVALLAGAITDAGPDER
ncbi:MAG: hypothetical protein V2J11_01870, partial [Desulfofustis sp.]|nr:hypothetical protein [Desulfofustis sp.]